MTHQLDVIVRSIESAEAQQMLRMLCWLDLQPRLIPAECDGEMVQMILTRGGLVGCEDAN